MIPTVVCVYFDGKGVLPNYSGGVYDWNWVEKLYHGVKANCEIPFKFLCLTDQPPDAPSSGIDIAPLLDSSEGWMCLNEVYRPNLDIQRGIFMGLDTVIIGDITHIMAWNGEFGLIRSPYRPHICCNAVVSFTPKWSNWLWNMWDIRRAVWREKCSKGLGPSQDGYPSEVIYLRHNFHEEWDYLDDIFPNQIVSWKAHGIREDTRIVYFHGDQKPHQIDDPTIQRAWA